MAERLVVENLGDAGVDVPGVGRRVAVEREGVAQAVAVVGEGRRGAFTVAEVSRSS